MKDKLYQVQVKFPPGFNNLLKLAAFIEEDLDIWDYDIDVIYFDGIPQNPSLMMVNFKNAEDAVHFKLRWI